MRWRRGERVSHVLDNARLPARQLHAQLNANSMPAALAGEDCFRCFKGLDRLVIAARAALEVSAGAFFGAAPTL